MTAEAFYRARNDLSELERLNDVLTQFWSENALPPVQANDVMLALEEVFANIVLHGYLDSNAHEILVRVAVDKGSVALVVEDDGVAFNPLDLPPVNTSLGIEDRPVGGLGIHLVRSVMDEISYARVDGRNRLEMRKRLLPPGT